MDPTGGGGELGGGADAGDGGGVQVDGVGGRVYGHHASQVGGLVQAVVHVAEEDEGNVDAGAVERGQG